MRPIITSDPMFAALTIPFNRVDISSELAILLPCYRYEVEIIDQDALMYYTANGKEQAMPIAVFCGLSHEFRQCLDVAKLKVLMISKVQARLNALSIDVTVNDFVNLTFLEKGA
jgi:hypothetical protein